MKLFKHKTPEDKEQDKKLKEVAEAARLETYWKVKQDTMIQKAKEKGARQAQYDVEGGLAGSIANSMKSGMKKAFSGEGAKSLSNFGKRMSSGFDSMDEYADFMVGSGESKKKKKKSMWEL